MDPRMLDYYNQELLHIREMGAEFAQEFPKIAARLGIEGIECADPYVERLLEGFAFLTARVQLKIDSEFPAFTQHLAEVVYPDYLAPVPSMTIARFEPDFKEQGLVAGRTLKRGTVLRGRVAPDTQSACEFQTAHDVTLWPIQVVEAKFLAYPPDLPREFNAPKDLKGALRLRLRTVGEPTFDKLKTESLSFYLSGDDATALKLYEYLMAASLGTLALPVKRGARWFEYAEGAAQKVGFSDEEALLPPPSRSFRGYRLLREYAAFPHRFIFVTLPGLGPAFRRCNEREIDLYVLLNRTDTALESVVDAANFTLYAAPAINLFAKTVDRIHITNQTFEHHVVPDRTRPMDFEIYSVKNVDGFGTGTESERRFRALYATVDEHDSAGEAFYTLRRTPRALSAKQKRAGSRSSYIGTELFLSLVETDAAPYSDDLKQLSIDTMCSNRDLPILMPMGRLDGDFTLTESAPVTAVFCLKGPSRPIAPVLDGSAAWRLISHLSLNYLSLTDTTPQAGAAALREMLMLYGVDDESAMRRQLEGIRSTEIKPIIRRLPSRGPVTFGRGFEIALQIEERAFEGASPFLLASVLEEFFARHASLNAFTEMALRVSGRGEIMRWPARFGVRPVL